MKTNALMMDSTDNVVTCVVEVKKGNTVKYLAGKQLMEIITVEDIPVCHKVAIAIIHKDDHVMKYGESIGTAECEIEIGGWVSHSNIKSIPRDYEREMY